MKDMTGNPRNGCSGPGSGDGAHIVTQKVSSGLGPDQQCGKVIWSGGCWHKLGFWLQGDLGVQYLPCSEPWGES